MAGDLLDAPLRDFLDTLSGEGPAPGGGSAAAIVVAMAAGLVTMVGDEIRFWNGSKIYLCHCKDEKDRFKYLGAEIHLLLIDQVNGDRLIGGR